jgi:DNA-binding NarL/FixJ family response regulator
MMAAMPTDVVLVSADLLLGSRLRAALRGTAAVTMVPTGTEVPVVGTVFVDLNADVDDRLRVIARLHDRGGVRVIGFCQHDQRKLRIRAMAEGADQVVTNGALQEAALRLVGAGSHG